METEYDLTQPWKSLDEWQKSYIETPPEQDCFLLTGRQAGKTTAMSIKAVELCMHNFREEQNILICSITEKQAYRMLAKALSYAETKYPSQIKRNKDDKPTMHRVIFKSGAGIYCYAAGETGEGLRGDTIKKLMIDEGSRMGEEFFISVTPMLSVSHGSMDIASTPFGKKDKWGNETFFYKCSKDANYKKFYASAEDCPRHSKEFLEKEKKRMTRLQYAQEYLAQFLDELRQVFSDDLIKKCCVLKRRDLIIKNHTYYLGCDIAGMGGSENSFEIIDRINKDTFEQVQSETTKDALTTETSEKIKLLNLMYNFRRIGIDDGGVGFGVFSELMDFEGTKRKTEALNNASRPIDREGEKKKKLLKEEMYMNLLILMEQGKIKLLNDDEVKASLSSMQHDDEGKIFGSYSHITEGIVRAAWIAARNKDLNIFARSF